MAPCNTNLWIFCGILFLHYSVLASDKPTVDTDSAPDKKSDASAETAFDDVNDPSVVTSDIPDDDEFWYDKRNIGRWRNANWLNGKRNLGRWRNRNWQNSRRLLPLAGYGSTGNSRSYYGHNIKKRFSDSYVSGDSYADASDSGIQLGGLADLLDVEDLPALGYYDSLGYGPYPSYPGSDVDKRQASRWSYIQRKLSNLSRNNKREYDDDVDKRSSSRWRFIQNKLSQLDGGKRSLGRWRNFNWQHAGRQ